MHRYIVFIYNSTMTAFSSIVFRLLSTNAMDQLIALQHFNIITANTISSFIMVLHDTVSYCDYRASKGEIQVSGAPHITK